MKRIKIFSLKRHKALLSAILLDVAVFLALVLLISGYVYYNRATILDKIVSRYLDNNVSLQAKSVNGNPSTEEEAVVNVVEKANPAVVSIVITKDVPIIEQYLENFSPFDGFFGQSPFSFKVPRYRQKGTEKKEVGGGSGFFVSEDGLVITNKHVVEDTEASYTVLTNDGNKYDAKVLARDSFLDIAVLKVKTTGVPYLSFGDSDDLKQGQTVIAIGNALGEFRNSVSVGVVSGLSRSIVAGDSMGKSELLDKVIQTDAAINPGNSGGPLLNLQGYVVGINVAMARGSENIGFALPVNTIKGVVSSVKKFGKIVYPYIGVRYMQVTKALKEKNNLPVDYGALVIRGTAPEELAVIPGSPADKAGILENDIILEVDGVKLDSKHSLGFLIRGKKVGDTVTLKILRKGKRKEVSVKLEKAPEGL